jgi:hypothetical protein
METFADTSAFNAGVKMEPVGIFMGICIDLLKKRKQN